MPARNLYHDAVVEALVADGWTVTADPLWMQFAGRDLYVDLAAERSTVAAQKGAERIAVEVQTFAAASDVLNLQRAVGQYGVYRFVLSRTDPDRRLYMGVDEETYATVLTEPFGQALVAEFGIRLVVFDPDARRVVRWTS